MAESVALVESLLYWSVVDKIFAPVQTLNEKATLRSGKLNELKKRIKENANITAVFVNINSLKYVKILELQKILKLPVYDRYSVIIHILRQRAKTPEAQLQVALAELPFIWKRIGELDTQCSGAINLLDSRRQFLRMREAKIKKALEKIKLSRERSRNRRKYFGLPSVAVVGYTNVGKTALIKVLSKDGSLVPTNQLFATLDTVCYEGLLPCGQKVLYFDTIGFIQDVPEVLLAPFIVTLEDAICSDVIIHLYDISHPDMKAQFEHVQEVIEPMLQQTQTVINVANKCDLVEELDVDENTIAVSCKHSTGIDKLQQKLEEAVFKATGRSVKRIRVQSGSLAATWLYKWTTVVNAEADANDPRYIIYDVVATDSTIDEFKRFLRE